MLYVPMENFQTDFNIIHNKTYSCKITLTTHQFHHEWDLRIYQKTQKFGLRVLAVGTIVLLYDSFNCQ